MDAQLILVPATFSARSIPRGGVAPQRGILRALNIPRADSPNEGAYDTIELLNSIRRARVASPTLPHLKGHTSGMSKVTRSPAASHLSARGVLCGGDLREVIFQMLPVLHKLLLQ